MVSKGASGNATETTRQTPGSRGSSGDEAEGCTRDVKEETSAMGSMPVQNVEMVELKKLGTGWYVDEDPQTAGTHKQEGTGRSHSTKSGGPVHQYGLTKALVTSGRPVQLPQKTSVGNACSCCIHAQHQHE